MSIEAMKMALELLENYVEDPRCEISICKTINALRQAIEQAEDAVLAEREACAKLVEADGLARGDEGLVLIKAAGRIRARGEA